MRPERPMSRHIVHSRLLTYARNTFVPTSLHLTLVMFLHTEIKIIPKIIAFVGERCSILQCSSKGNTGETVLTVPCALQDRGGHSRGQRLQQVLPELQRHQVGQTIKGGVAVKRRQVNEKEGQELAGAEEREWGSRREERRVRLVSQMAGLFVWAAWHGEGVSSICLSTAVAKSPAASEHIWRQNYTP